MKTKYFKIQIKLDEKRCNFSLKKAQIVYLHKTCIEVKKVFFELQKWIKI